MTQVINDKGELTDIDEDSPAYQSGYRSGNGGDRPHFPLGKTARAAYCSGYIHGSLDRLGRILGDKHVH